MLYDLWLENDSGDLDTRINNVTNFYHWCVYRLMPQNRQYVKEILNSIGVPSPSPTGTWP